MERNINNTEHQPQKIKKIECKRRALTSMQNVINEQNAKVEELQKIIFTSNA